MAKCQQASLGAIGDMVLLSLSGEGRREVGVPWTAKKCSFLMQRKYRGDIQEPSLES